MIDFLYGLDVALFRFINGTLSNPVGDILWPFITDYDKVLPVRILLICVWLFLLIKGGVRGRTVALLVIPLIVLSDKVNSSLIKAIVARPRPCHEIDGIPIVQGIHLLVQCGPGMSFASSHAVNNFAVATLFAHYYKKGFWAFYGWASLVALSRTAVGVHYPSDILGGAVIGVLLGLGLIKLWTLIQDRFFPKFAVHPPGGPRS